jgi:hypothetical protein
VAKRGDHGAILLVAEIDRFLNCIWVEIGTAQNVTDDHRKHGPGPLALRRPGPFDFDAVAIDLLTHFLKDPDDIHGAAGGDGR